MHAIWTRCRVTILPFVATFGLLFAAACGDDGLTNDPGNPFEEPGGGFDGSVNFDTSVPGEDASTLPEEDGGAKPDTGGTVDPPDKDTVEPPVGDCVVEFVEVTGDDGQPCKGTSECALTLNFNGSRKVTARYLCDGAPFANGLLTFDLIGEEAKTILDVNPNVSYTADDGTASATVSVANNNVGTFELRVAADDDQNTQPISYQLTVESKLGPPLTVKFNPLYDKTQVKFDKIETTLYKHTDGKPFECATIDPTEQMPAGGIGGLPKVVKVEEAVVVPQLPKLEEDGHQWYTVIATARTAQGALKLVGCNDADAKVEFGKSTTVTVDLYAVSPDYAGEYEVTTFLDLTSALPPNVKQIFDVIFGLFESPTGGLMLLVCGLDVSALDSICGIVFNDPDNPKIGEWGQWGELIVKTADAILLSLIEKSPIASDIFYTGKDLGQILQNLEMHSTIVILPIPPKMKGMPDIEGWFTKEQCSQTWTGVTFSWTLGSGCDPSDPGCGAVYFSFEQFQGDIVSSQFEAQVTPTFYDMNVYDHSVNFKYGALLNEIIKQIILPAIFGDEIQYAQNGNAYENTISSFLCGDSWKDPSLDCCQVFAENIDVGAIENTLKTACKSLIPVGVSYLESLLQGLDVDVDNLKLRTAESCKLIDSDGDGVIDAWGTVTNPCYWDINLSLFNFEANFDAEFSAVRKKKN